MWSGPVSPRGKGFGPCVILSTFFKSSDGQTAPILLQKTEYQFIALSQHQLTPFTRITATSTYPHRLSNSWQLLLCNQYLGAIMQVRFFFEPMDEDPTVDYNLMLKPRHHHIMKICKLLLTPPHPPLYVIA
jgi:hypothetical protein